MAASYPQCPLPAGTTCLTYLTRGQSIGLTVALESGFVSVAAVLLLFCVVIRNIRRSRRNFQGKVWRFFRSPLDVYMLSLLVSDFIQGLGKILHVKWINDGIVQCGSFCTTQGVIQQLGETSVAQATLAIAVHTFIIIFFRKGAKAIRVAYFVVSIIWIFVILFIIISTVTHAKDHEPYITPTPYWCWIAPKFTADKLWGEYFWLWFTAFLSIALYIPLFFCLRGDIAVDPEKWWIIRFPRRTAAVKRLGGVPVNSRDVDPRVYMASHEASKMLLYPASYFLLVFANSVCRWIGFDKIPSGAAFFGSTLFGLSGLVNVVLLLYTRPGLLLLTEPPVRHNPSGLDAVLRNVTSNIKDEGSLRLRALNPHPVLNMPTSEGEYSRNMSDA